MYIINRLAGSWTSCVQEGVLDVGDLLGRFITLTHVDYGWLNILLSEEIQFVEYLEGAFEGGLVECTFILYEAEVIQKGLRYKYKSLTLMASSFRTISMNRVRCNSVQLTDCWTLLLLTDDIYIMKKLTIFWISRAFSSTMSYDFMRSDKI